MRCTWHAQRQDCSAEAREHLQWCEQIREGWTFTVDRMLCPEHAERLVQSLAPRGVFVNRKPLQVRR